jgi:hypothetical protein
MTLSSEQLIAFDRVSELVLILFYLAFLRDCFPGCGDDEENDLDNEENWSCFYNIDWLTVTPIHLRIVPMTCCESIVGHQKIESRKRF